MPVSKKLIEGVALKPLKVFPDERGRLMEILRRDDEIFLEFGQVYLTTGYSGIVKAWHFHELQTDNFCVVKGMMKIALYDARENSPTFETINEFYLGEQNPMLLRIPAFVYHGFKTISDTEAFLINIPTNTYNYSKPDEYRQAPHGIIPYDWARQDG